MAVQAYLREKLLNAGFRVLEDGGPLQRSDGGGAGLEAAAACAISRTAAPEDPAPTGCNAVPLDPPFARHARTRSPHQNVSSQDGGDAGAAVESVPEPKSTDRVSKQDMLRYEAGLLSKHDLLVTAAKRRIASPRA